MPSDESEETAYKARLSFESHLYHGGLAILMLGCLVAGIILRIDAMALVLVAGFAGVILFLYVGEMRAFRIARDGRALLLKTRHKLMPFSRAQIDRIAFDTIHSISVESGPGSHWGPQVVGENVIVLATDKGPVRISSRWIAADDFDQLVRELRRMLKSRARDQ